MESKTRLLESPPPRQSGDGNSRHFTLSNAILAVFSITFGLFTLLYWTPAGLVKLPQWTHHCIHKVPLSSQRVSYDTLKDILLNTPEPAKAREWSQFYTKRSHLPGQGLNNAEWTRAKWREFGIPDVEITSHNTSLTYPDTQRLTLRNTTGPADQVLYEAMLAENVTNDGDFIPAFFTGPVFGNVTAPFVFVNWGLKEDIDDLHNAHVSLEGKIAIMKSVQVSPSLENKNQHISRAEQADNALLAGAVGVIMYSDPESDGFITEANGYKAFPDGPARPPTMIERGGLTSEHGFVAPSIPISYADAIPLLTALNGHGPAAADFNERWQRGGLGYKGVKYNVGPSPEGIELNLAINVDRWNGQVHNVLGTVKGSVMPDEVVILGAHSDAWGPGAGDAGSGLSALNEVARSFGAALKTGWRPTRTIIFASFEGEEFGLDGARGWLNENREWVNTEVMAYLNVVVAGSGTKLRVKASPLLNKAIYNATSQVPSPNENFKGQTILDVWGGHIGAGSGGDAMVFTYDECIASLDMSFSPDVTDPILPYHSQFDTVEWMDKYGDPTWEYHTTTAKIWGLIAATLLETPVLAVNAADYASALKQYLDQVRHSHPLPFEFDYAPLYNAIQRLAQAAVPFDQHAAELASRLDTQQDPESTLYEEVRAVNRKYIALERQFSLTSSSDPGMPPKPQHAIQPMSSWHMDSEAFPLLTDAFSYGNATLSETMRDIIASRIDAAADSLV